MKLYLLYMGKLTVPEMQIKSCLVNMCFWSTCFHFRVSVAYALSDCLTFDIAWLQGEASLFNFSELSPLTGRWVVTYGCYINV